MQNWLQERNRGTREREGTLHCHRCEERNSVWLILNYVSKGKMLINELGNLKTGFESRLQHGEGGGCSSWPYSWPKQQERSIKMHGATVKSSSLQGEWTTAESASTKKQAHKRTWSHPALAMWGILYSSYWSMSQNGRCKSTH